MPALNPRRVLLSTDFSDNAATAIPYACALAQHYEAHLLLVHVIHANVDHLRTQVVSAAMDPALLEAKQKAQRQLSDLDLGDLPRDRIVREVVCATSAATGILDVAKQHHADWIVMGYAWARHAGTSGARKCVASDSPARTLSSPVRQGT